MKSKLGVVFSCGIIACLLCAPYASPAARLCDKCRDLMFTDTEGKCTICGAPTTSGAMKLCPKCSAERRQCEHCLAPLTDKDLTASESAPVAPSPPGTLPDDRRPIAPTTPELKPDAPASGDGQRSQSPARLPATASPDLPPPASTAQESAAPAQPKPIHPGRAGTYTSGKWRFQLQINGAGTRNEGRWGWLTYDGKKLPRGNVNDYYDTPWGPMYWVDAPQNAAGLHGFMPIPSPQTSRRGREMAMPAFLLVGANPATTNPAPAASAVPSPAAKVQTLEINRSQNGQTARLHVGNVLVVHLPGNPASGYQWQAGTSNTKALRLTVRPQYTPPAGNAAAGSYTLTYEAAQTGSGYLRLYYVRAGDTSHPRDAFAIGVNVSPASSQSARSSVGSPDSR